MKRSEKKLLCLYICFIVNGIWVEWSDWTGCTLTCGNGTKTRNRTCNGPFFGGEECDGAVNETVLCNSFYCPGKKKQWIYYENLNPIKRGKKLRESSRV